MTLGRILHPRTGKNQQESTRINKNVTLKKEGRNWVLRRFQQLRSYHDEIETRNWEEIPYSSRIVPRGLSVA